MLEDGIPTPSSTEQCSLEHKVCDEYYAELAEHLQDMKSLQLRRDDHSQYLLQGLRSLPAGFVALDASRPWICFWTLHSLALLDVQLHQDSCPNLTAIVSFLSECQSPTGGFGGGPQQLPHLATTYAAVASLVTVGGDAALSAVNRSGLQSFLHSCCVPPAQGGGMMMHQGGEVDVRGCYTAVAAAHMTGLDKHDIANRSGLVDFVSRCQSYEGGIGGEPGNEAHGGYTYCGVAALMLLQRTDVLHIPRLLHWLVYKQGIVEGGFAGRTNKLVDGCYTFWQGALMPLMHDLGPGFFSQMGPQAGPRAHCSSAKDGSGLKKEEGDDVDTVPSAGHETSDPMQANRKARAVELSAKITIRVPQVLTLQQRGPAAQAVAAIKHLETQLTAGSAHSFPANVTPPASLPLRASVILERAETHRRLLHSSACALTDGQTRRLMQQQDTQHAQHGTGGELEIEGLQDEDHESQPAAARADGRTDNRGRDGHDVQQEQPRALGDCDDWKQHAHAHHHDGSPFCNCSAVQLWVLACCQGMRGLRDKPGKSPDYYHTCYCLSGLSAMQQYQGYVMGLPENRLRRADLLCNVVQEQLDAARDYYSSAALA